MERLKRQTLPPDRFPSCCLEKALHSCNPIGSLRKINFEKMQVTIFQLQKTTQDDSRETYKLEVSPCAQTLHVALFWLKFAVWKIFANKKQVRIEFTIENQQILNWMFSSSLLPVCSFLNYTLDELAWQGSKIILPPNLHWCLFEQLNSKWQFWIIWEKMVDHSSP